uniref:Peroxin-7 n=1 Tax=Albugo laibachii Nc14 TaxID=890382 RepID=F0WK75_9STRA|nr:peroxisomal targeting signal 2 receptor putative [Albugo laibachii Nc14]|eukprot:CCA21678.1 peroxisomal targeting signal 2 receptor putative [Albugo laibachii Nc14]
MFLHPTSARTKYPAFAVEFNPFHEGRVAVSTSQYFGIVGNGRQHVFELLPSGQFASVREFSIALCINAHILSQIRHFDTNNGIYDCAWSESHADHLVTACGNGLLQFWHLKTQDSYPILMYKEHTKDIVRVQWNLVAKDSFLSASWDPSVKLWTPERTQSIQTYREHTRAVYDCSWNAHNSALFASCGSDGDIKLWNTLVPASIHTIAKAHAGNEILALDWNKYNAYQLVSGSADASIRVWDIRSAQNPLRTLEGHSYGIRRLKCSPHDTNVFGSVSYDMTASVWDLGSQHARIQVASRHSEFIFGIDFNLFREGWIATCSWDCELICWNYFSGPP